MSASANSRPKWTLTQEAFDGLLALLGEGRESAGEKYLALRTNLIRFFAWRGCSFPEDHADETINRLARKISQGEQILNPSSYALGVARMLLLEISKARAKEHVVLSEMASAPITSPNPSELEPRIECLRACLQQLSAENRELIIRYYQGEKAAKIQNRKRLLERFGIPINTLRMRALRLREKLQACVEACLRN